MVPDLFELLGRALAGARAARWALAFWGPVVDARALVEPLLAVASVVTLALLSGVAVGALVTLLVALSALYVLLTEFFGVSVDLDLA